MRGRLRMLVGTVALGACLRSYGKVQETISPSIPGTRFHTLTVIASGDDDSDIRIAIRVRRSLEDAGFKVLPAPGRWETELAALEGICRAGQAADSVAQAAPPAVDGVVFAAWDRLLLRECATERVAYEIRGSWSGVDYMVRRLVEYLRGKRG